MSVRYPQYRHSVSWPLKPPVHNQLPSRYRSHKASYGNFFVPKLVAMATSLRHSIWAMSSSDSLTPKNPSLESNSMSLAIIQRPLVAGYQQFLHFVGCPLKPPSITNCLDTIVHTKPVNWCKLRSRIGWHGNVPQHLCTQSNTWCLGIIWAHNPNGISSVSAVFVQMNAGCRYTLQWDATFPPQNCPFPWEI